MGEEANVELIIDMPDSSDMINDAKTQVQTIFE